MAQLPIYPTDSVGVAFTKTNTNFTDVYAIHQKTATLSANVATLTANSTNYVGVTPAINVINTVTLAATLSSYATTSNVLENIYNRTANNTSYVGVSPATTVVNVSTLTSYLGSYATTSDVLENIYNRTANNTSYVGVSPATTVVNVSTLTSYLGSYATITYVNSRIYNSTANSTNYVGATPASAVINTTSITATLAYYPTNSYLQATYSNNSQLATYFASYQTEAGLAANVVNLTSYNASRLGNIPASQYVNTSGAYTITGVHTHTANVSIYAALSANGSYGTAGQVLTTSGVDGNVYWSTISGGGSGSVTSIVAANGINGGTVTTTGTISIRANTGIIANASGVFVNAAYINAISANSAAFLGAIAASGYQTTAGLSANVAKLTANSASFLGTIGPNEIVTSTSLATALSYTVSRADAKMVGNVGINNTAPVDALTVGGTSYFHGNVRFTQGIRDSANNAGTLGSVLSSNGSSNVYWIHLSSYAGSINAASYSTGNGYGTATALGGAIVNTTYIAVGNSTQNASLTSAGLLLNGEGFISGGGYYKGNKGIAGSQTNLGNIFRINSNQISNNITIAAGENAQATGPIVVGSGFNLLIQTGGRAVII